MIYLDNAASSYPKPPQVAEAVADCLNNLAASPGRGQHRLALAAGRIVRETRSGLAKLLGVADPANVIFTANATEALNLAIKGWVRPGDKVVTTWVEHNSVYRPLGRLAAEAGVSVALARCDERGYVDLDDWRKQLTTGTRLAVVAHASNVLGTIQPLSELVEIATDVGVPVLVDAAQSAGAIELDIEALGLAMVAFTGHKSLLGPQGTGGLYVSPKIEIRELIVGGTGTGSMGPQPQRRPDRYESGTYNTPGLAGLGAAANYLLGVGVAEVCSQERRRTEQLIEGLAGIEGLCVYGPPIGEPRTSVVSLVVEGASPAELAGRLDRDYEIYVRSGWLCAPKVHALIGTEKTGVLRLSPGLFSTDRDVEAVVSALRELRAR